MKVDKDNLCVGLRFLLAGPPEEFGSVNRVVAVYPGTVLYRRGQNGTEETFGSGRELFLSSGHTVLNTGDVNVPEVAL
jgi:hypothetical protein